MSVAEWADTYGIYHWQILWSSYRNLASVGFEPTTTEFRSDALIDWAIRPWVQLELRANFLQLLQFHRLFSVAEWAHIYGIHHCWILWISSRKLALVAFEPTTTEFLSDALTDWAIRPWVQPTLTANFVQLLQFHCFLSVTFHFGCFPSSVATFIVMEVLCR